ncbi:hypothetical protein H1D32_16395 [Anaerobacillus sp. CMMVII]|uniref:hypothetical protein n=1 Tax=Anaerobacillus sp. CMMVII TaxID=2755588 RepID=UPI0021B7A493|nr:hypothetical protein [Anaerobacillus sp. CMMVII]MCT8139145.1 hypothetical protein [Anaerobacillus sp. CMMVII]
MNEELKELLRSVLKEELKPIHQQLDKFDLRFDEVDNRFKKIDERFDEVDNRFKKIDERFDEVDNRFKKIDHRFDVVDHRLLTIEGDVKGLKDNIINGLGPYFEQITDHIDEVLEITNKQQIVIDTLSVRSIKHESEINEIKEY